MIIHNTLESFVVLSLSQTGDRRVHTCSN